MCGVGERLAERWIAGTMVPPQITLSYSSGANYATRIYLHAHRN